ncbi:MAG: nucleotidyltransferase family protein [Arenicellales bacterium]|nr:nucleotidyltransferase family protein [Arenicellales bacterium]
MRIAGLLMAAGAGRRFAGCKQLAPINGKPLVRNSLEQLAAVTGTDTYTVLGAYREEILPSISDLTSVIVNADWEEGLGRSIAIGVEKIKGSNRYDAVLIALADQHRLRYQDYMQLINRFDGQRVVAANYDGYPGVPAIFPKNHFDRLCELEGDCGARKMLEKMQAEVEMLALTAALYDIDTTFDL